jgi:hypothetical protein
MSTQTPTTVTPAAVSDWGWNYGLTDPNTTSPFPGEANYFSNETDPAPGTSHWTVAIESEDGPGASAPGPACQSFPIENITGAPTTDPGVATIQFAPTTTPTGGTGYDVELKTNLYNYAQPAGGGYYTWYAFGENVDLNGGPLPLPNIAAFDVDLLYNEYLPNAGARVSVIYQGYWDNESHQIEIDLTRQSDDWGANTGQLVQNTRITPGLDFIEVNGSALGLSLIPGVETAVHIEWSSVLQTLISQGALAAPSGGWSDTASQAFYVSTELDNHAASQSGIADLWLSGFRISGDAGTTPSSTTPIGGSGGDPPPGMVNVTTYASGTVVTDALTGNTVQTLPPVASDTMQFLSIDNVTFSTNLASARSIGLDPAQLHDYDGNALGGSGQWQMLGLASVTTGSLPSYILTNPTTGRWAEVAERPNGTFNFANYGNNGDTRVVGVYLDPLVTQGIVAKGSPTDSQIRFTSDIEANRLALLGSVFDQMTGEMDLMFKLTNHSADHADDVFLRAILHNDGNIAYANYMNTSQFTAWMASDNVAPAVYANWLTKM